MISHHSCIAQVIFKFGVEHQASQVVGGVSGTPIVYLIKSLTLCGALVLNNVNKKRRVNCGVFLLVKVVFAVSRDAGAIRFIQAQ